MMRSASWVFLGAVWVCAGGALSAGCSSVPQGASDTANEGESAAEVGLSLNLAGTTLNSAEYVIVGPAGYAKSGSLNLSHSSTLSAVIGGLPVGTGYSLNITATAADGSAKCAGGASFDVAAKVTTAVPVALACRETKRTGGIAISGTLNVCPVIDGLSASPSEVLVGSTVALSVTAHDSDSAPAALAYNWTADTGSLSERTSASPIFKCTAPGVATVTVSANDGDPAAGCADTSSIQVQCSIPSLASGRSSVALYGDAPYGTTPTDNSETLATPAFIANVNADPDVSLVLHVGDIHSGKQYCTEAYNRVVFNLWQSFEDPLVYTPGDNEWSDCHKVAEGGGTYNATTGQIDYVLAGGVPVDYASGDPLANLSLVRSIFFAQPGVTLGSQKQVLSQAQYFDAAHPTDANYVENVMFEQSKVLFVAINLPGGSNNDNDIWYGAPTQSAAQAQEVAERTGADLRWLDAAFVRAQADGMVAVVVEAQADMWDAEKGAAHQAAYEPFIQNIASHTLAFAKPVLMFNGDSHVYQSGNPLDPTDPAYAMHPGYNVPNFHRIVVHGSTIPLEWLKLDIDPTVNAPRSVSGFGPFAWSRKIQP